MDIKEEIVKRVKERSEKFNLWASIKDWVISFAVAAVAYFVILPLFLGSSTPLVVVSSCSEKPYLNIGDIVVVQGVAAKDVKAQNIDALLNESLISFNENLVVNNETFSKNSANDIIIYYARPSGMQIIHRALLKFNNEKIITMGDANNAPDQVGVTTGTFCIDQNNGCLSTAVTQQMLVGKNIFAVPLLGHVKLFFCDIMPFCDGHANVGTNYKYMLTC